MSSKNNDNNNDNWGFSLSSMKISNNVKEPLGINFLSSNENDNAKAKRKEQNQMKINKAWDLVIGQGKGIFMTFISTFFIGSNISLFTIFIYGYYAFNTFTAIFNVNKAYKMLESPEYSLFNYKIAYVFLSMISFFFVMYRIYKMGLVPLNPADWVSLIDKNYPEKEIINLNN